MAVLLIKHSCAFPNVSTSHKHICAARQRTTHRVGTFPGCPHLPPASLTQNKDLRNMPSNLIVSGHGSSAHNSMPYYLVFAMQALFTIILGWPSCLSSNPAPFQTFLPATNTSASLDCTSPIVLALSLDVPIRPPASSTQPSQGNEDLSNMPSDLNVSGHGRSAHNSMPNHLVFAMQTVAEFVTEASMIERTLDMRLRQYDRPLDTLSVNPVNAPGIVTKDLRETIRAVVREELSKLFSATPQPQVAIPH
ncbi:hypothetical protein HPB51_018178 [Rhipicephalus microplus]|uniref:Uncharacterized protein n=1 Tax=Rhipicephalus microplus TaxID=6941 RepID=A0A9J6D621_RHIMP|nr:hypothetical protein HPB51_018178 [Rhipicephalus microplus]